MARIRLIDLLNERTPAVDDPDLALAESRVTVDGAVITNPASQVRPDARIVVKARKEPQGVVKLGHALDRFDVDVAGAVAVDLGACTGGFTLALLARGAAKVFAVDVGFGQLLGSLRQDERVVNLEKTNVSEVTPALLNCRPDLVVVDVTRLKLRDVAAQLIANDVPKGGTQLVGLVKPAFELGLAEMPTNQSELDRALETAAEGVRAAGWSVVATMESEVRGHSGATEYFIHAAWPVQPAS
ncbi:MAG TPA: SAM-dependent methyltransferase [Acidimicrobiales bacterium]|nr:SAM-dependent methyltransferase [Acidimicrobiales bacterium]